MNFLQNSFASLLLLAVLSFSVSGCGLVKAPFRVAGALGNGAYQGGKKAVNASSNALEKRKLRKEKEKAAAEAAKEKKAAAQGAGEAPLPAANPPAEGPIIPLPESTPLPPPN